MKHCLKGGRHECLKILKDLKLHKKYEEERDILALDGTTKLSPYLKFNVCSIREVYYAIKQELGSTSGQPLSRQLYWRDFYTQIGYYFPKVFTENFRCLKYMYACFKKTVKRTGPSFFMLFFFSEFNI